MNAETTEYKVELDVYNGPMDLLLYLIKKEEVDIYDIHRQDYRPVHGIPGTVGGA